MHTTLNSTSKNKQNVKVPIAKGCNRKGNLYHLSTVFWKKKMHPTGMIHEQS
jgi:hypothetical protein